MEVLELSKTRLLDEVGTMNPKDCKVLLYMASNADEDNRITISPSKVCKSLGMAKKTLSTSLRSLKNAKMVGVVSSLGNGHGHIYRIALEDTDIENYIQGKLF